MLVTRLMTSLFSFSRPQHCVSWSNFETSFRPSSVKFILWSICYRSQQISFKTAQKPIFKSIQWLSRDVILTMCFTISIRLHRLLATLLKGTSSKMRENESCDISTKLFLPLQNAWCPSNAGMKNPTSSRETQTYLVGGAYLWSCSCFSRLTLLPTRSE